VTIKLKPPPGRDMSRCWVEGCIYTKGLVKTRMDSGAEVVMCRKHTAQAFKKIPKH
jgi:hypothetical protein